MQFLGHVLLGEILHRRGLVSHTQIHHALQLQLATGLPLGACLTQIGAVTEEQVESAAAHQAGLRQGKQKGKSVKKTQAGGPAQKHVVQASDPQAAEAKGDEASGLTLRGDSRPDVSPSGTSSGTAEGSGYWDSVNDWALGEILKRLGVVDEADLNRAQEVQRAAGIRIGEALIEMGVATWEQISRALRVQSHHRGSGRR